MRPDAKSQVTVEYQDNKPIRVHTVVVSTQHSPDVKHETIKADMIEKVVKQVVPANLLDSKTIYHINPTGRFVIGGPQGRLRADGEKDYRGLVWWMGTSRWRRFFGERPNEVDRSACYAARHVAKNVVASGRQTECEAQVAYAIGVAKPLAVHITTEGTGKISDENLRRFVESIFDLTPGGIIKRLNLRRPIYKITARTVISVVLEDTFTWEKTDMVDALRKGCRCLNRDNGLSPRSQRTSGR